MPDRGWVVETLAAGGSMAHADLRGADLSCLVFDACDATCAKFGDANLAGASFRNARLVGASFWQANCAGASFEGADLEDADFDHAFLDGVTLRAARIRRTLFPTGRISREALLSSVRDGVPLKMDPRTSSEGGTADAPPWSRD